MYEDQYDLEKWDHLQKLTEVLITSGRGEPDQRKADAVLQVNKVLVQRLAMQRLVQLAHNDSSIFDGCFNAIKHEVEIFKRQCNLKGDLYIEVERTVKNKDGSVQKVAEQILQSSANAFTSKLYQYLKLAICLLNRDHLDGFNLVYYILMGPAEED